MSMDEHDMNRTCDVCGNRTIYRTCNICSGKRAEEAAAAIPPPTLEEIGAAAGKAYWARVARQKAEEVYSTAEKVFREAITDERRLANAHWELVKQRLAKEEPRKCVRCGLEVPCGDRDCI